MLSRVVLSRVMSCRQSGDRLFFSSSDGLSLLSVEAYGCYVYAEVTRACLTGPNVGCGCSIRAEKTERLFSSLSKRERSRIQSWTQAGTYTSAVLVHYMSSALSWGARNTFASGDVYNFSFSHFLFLPVALNLYPQKTARSPSSLSSL